MVGTAQNDFASPANMVSAICSVEKSSGKKYTADPRSSAENA